MHPRIEYAQYQRKDLPLLIDLIQTDLSESYSIYTYYYFLEECPHLCLTAWETVDHLPNHDVRSHEASRILHDQPSTLPMVEPPNTNYFLTHGGHSGTKLEEHARDSSETVMAKSASSRRLIGVIIGRNGPHGRKEETSRMRGYIGMLAVVSRFRGRGIGKLK
jgi:ribosomal protein S18 acetylase RimI-like enzyme